MQDETALLANACLARLGDETGIVPTLFWFEVRNLLVINERRGRLSIDESAVFLERLHRLAIDVDRDPDSDAVMDLARRHRLTVYDAAHLELVRRLAAPLATLDRRLASAGIDEGVQPFEP